MGELQRNLSERFKMASESFKKIRGTFPKTAPFNRIMQVPPSPNSPQNVGFWQNRERSCDGWFENATGNLFFIVTFISEPITNS